MSRLNEKRIKELTPETRPHTIWDDNPIGLGVKVNKSGSKSFILKYRNKSGQQRKMKLGTVGVLKLEQARKLAKEKLVEISKGGDPAHERKEAKAAPKVEDLLKKYLDEHSKVNNKPNTYTNNKA